MRWYYRLHLLLEEIQSYLGRGFRSLLDEDVSAFRAGLRPQNVAEVGHQRMYFLHIQTGYIYKVVSRRMQQIAIWQRQLRPLELSLAANSPDLKTLYRDYATAPEHTQIQLQYCPSSHDRKTRLRLSACHQMQEYHRETRR